MVTVPRSGARHAATLKCTHRRRSLLAAVRLAESARRAITDVAPATTELAMHATPNSPRLPAHVACGPRAVRGPARPLHPLRSPDGQRFVPRNAGRLHDRSHLSSRARVRTIRQQGVVLFGVQQTQGGYHALACPARHRAPAVPPAVSGARAAPAPAPSGAGCLHLPSATAICRARHAELPPCQLNARIAHRCLGSSTPDVCPRCTTTWDDEWDCMCDDDCPNCGTRHIAPTESREVHGADNAAAQGNVHDCAGQCAR
jgi:hypothetical protein